MNGPNDADWLRRALASRAREAPSPTPDCLDDGTIAALAEGSLPAAVRTGVLPHLAGCAPCREAVASVARALADPAVAREVSAAERGGSRRLPWAVGIPVGVAAAAALMLLAWPPPRQDARMLPHRAPPITAAPAAEAVWPVGTVAEATSLRWTPVPGADRYRVTLFAAEGIELYEAELTGTLVALPDSVLPAPGETYWWRVDARVGFDRWATSELFEFSVAGGARR